MSSYRSSPNPSTTTTRCCWRLPRSSATLCNLSEATSGHSACSSLSKRWQQSRRRCGAPLSVSEWSAPLPEHRELIRLAQQVVREKAVEALCAVGEQIPAEHVSEYYADMLRRLSSGDWFTSRVSSCGYVSGRLAVGYAGCCLTRRVVRAACSRSRMPSWTMRLSNCSSAHSSARYATTRHRWFVEQQRRTSVILRKWYVGSARSLRQLHVTNTCMQC
jgi:hypothetical protein